MLTERGDGRSDAPELVVVRRSGREVLRVEPWGTNSVRVRAAMGEPGPNQVGALEHRPPSEATIERNKERVRIVIGSLIVDIDERGWLTFRRFSDGEELLAEEPIHFWWPGPRNFTSVGNGHYQIVQKFRAYPEERLFGLGQHQHGRLDQKGLVIDLVQRNAEVSIPFLVSSRGYGILWNNPAVGRVELGMDGTRWVAESSQQIDYWVTTGSPAEIASQYADATGHAPKFPKYAAGFWQSKLRYRTQEELLVVAREHKSRGLPLSVIVCDFFHWPQLGDWCFEPSEWPDPSAMVKELDELGVRLVVSVWPSVSILSRNYRTMLERGLLIGNDRGLPFHSEWPDRGASTEVPVAFYDSSKPAARAYLWDQLEKNYVPFGIHDFWLDACEPEMCPAQPENLELEAGLGLEVINRYPADHARAIYDGKLSAGDDEVISLIRSAWAGSQRWGACVWSGDIPTTFESLRNQVRAGLNIGLSGIPWWNSDIGGFHGGDARDPEYQELVVRWFQFGLWCPLFRLHGDREPRIRMGTEMTGGPNEVWSFGDTAYGIISRLLHLRESLQPYILEQMQVASDRGIPPMRPLWFDAPDDPVAWSIEDEFNFGPDVLVAPVTEGGVRQRSVYLPTGNSWRHVVTNEVFAGGTWVDSDAPLEWIPVFVRETCSAGLKGALISERDLGGPASVVSD